MSLCWKSGPSERKWLIAALTLGFSAWSCIGPAPSFDGGPTDGGFFQPPDGGHDAGPPDACVSECVTDGGPQDAGDAGVVDDGGPDDAGPDDGGIDAGDGGPGPGDGGDAGDGGIDAGVDGGPDAGTQTCTLTDPFTPTGFNAFAGFGQACDFLGRVGSCTGGLDCIVPAPGSVGVCGQRSCFAPDSCGPDNAGVCVAGSPTACLPTCDSQHACPTNSVCVTNGRTDTGACFTDCRIEPSTFCTTQFGPRTVCNASSGRCEQKSCSQNSECGAAGVCDLTHSPHVCAVDCRMDPGFCCSLGSGQTCGNNGLCTPGGPYPVMGLQLDFSNIRDPLPDGGPDAGIIEEDGGIDAGFDAGPEQIDAGLCEPYVGPVMPDAGPVVANAVMGSRCANGTAGPRVIDIPQSNCANGLLCYATQPYAGVCSKVCGSGADCGSNVGIQNTCINGSCWVSCDSTHSCPTGMVCENSLGTTATVCLPDCRSQWPTFCWNRVGNTTCNPSNGKCETISCAASSCPAGLACDTSTSPAHCVEDCTDQTAQYCCGGLSTAFVCDETTRACILMPQ